MSVKERTALDENTLIDAIQLAETVERPFRDSDIRQWEEQGIDLQTAAEMWVERYEGNNSFVRSVQNYYKRRGSITSAQARGVMNVIRDDRRTAASEDAEETPPPTPEPEHECAICHEEFHTFDQLDEHRQLFHGGKERPQAYADTGEAQAVLEDNSSTLGLDISNLPDGRYAAPDRSGQNDYIFLMVKRVRKTTQRDRRYVWGKEVVGNEVVVAGTIEVREWKSDSKEWVGAQKPGDVYRGKFEEDLQLIMMMPEHLALLFGKLIGRCTRCGRHLTDDESRAIGMGLECEKHLSEYRNLAPKYTYVGTDRPDKDKANPLDEKYLTGELKRYVKP